MKKVVQKLKDEALILSLFKGLESVTSYSAYLVPQTFPYAPENLLFDLKYSIFKYSPFPTFFNNT